MADSIDSLIKEIESLNREIELSPNEWQLYKSRGKFYNRRGNLTHSIEDYYSAINDYTTAIGLFNNDWELFEFRGDSYYNIGGLTNNKDDYSSSIEDYTKAISLNPNNWELYSRRGYSFFIRGIILDSKEDYTSAIEDYTKAISLNPDNWELYSYRGNSFHGRGIILKSKEDFSSAIEDFTKAISLNPDNWKLYDHRGVSFNDRGIILKSKEDYTSAIEDYTSAIEDCTKAISLNPDNWELYFKRGNSFNNRGIILESKEDYTSAIEDYTKAISLNPDNWELYSYRGNSFHGRGIILESKEDYTSAIEDCTKAISLNPDNWELYSDRGKSFNNRGHILKSKEDYTSAIEDCTKAISLNLDNWELYSDRGGSFFNRGGILKSKEDYTSAIEDYTQAISLNPDNWELYSDRGDSFNNRGVILDSKDDYSSAIEDYTKALSKGISKSYYGRAMAYRNADSIMDSLLDLNSFIFKTKGIFDNPKYGFRNIDIIYQNEPYNHLMLLLYLINTNQFPLGLLSKFYHLNSELYDFLLLFKYLDFNPLELSTHNQEFSRIIPILIYHLNGSVPAFRYYDEKLDDGNNELKAQDYYYFIKSALRFSPEVLSDIGIDSLISDAINNLSQQSSLSSEDYYYFGLILYLRILEFEMSDEERLSITKQALDCFKKSNGSVWSEAMICLIENGTSCESTERYIQSHCNSTKSIDISHLLSNNASDFISQFNDYIHFQEVIDFSPCLFEHVVFYNPIWEVFSLSYKDSMKLKDSLRKVSAVTIFKELAANKEKEGLKELSTEEETIINDYIFYKTENDDEKNIRHLLEDMVDEDLCLKKRDVEAIRRYLALNKKITIEQYLLTGFYYNEFNNDQDSYQLLESTFELINAIIKFAISIPVVLGPFKALIQKSGEDIPLGFESEKERRARYGRYSNFKEFCESVMEVGLLGVNQDNDTDAFDILVL